jgi:rubrerythrin
MPTKEALERLDRVMNQLVQADQTGTEIDPLDVAHELGEVRTMLLEGTSVVPRPGGQGHYRCESCGTITHGDAEPSRCPKCGGRRFFKADLEMPIVDAGPA